MKTEKTIESKLGFWAKLNRGIEAMEKTETDYLSEYIQRLQSVIDQMEDRVRALEQRAHSL